MYRLKIDPSTPKVPTYPPTYVMAERLTIGAYLDNLAAAYRRSYDVKLPECIALAVEELQGELSQRLNGARISDSAAATLLLGSNLSSQTIAANVRR